MSAYNRRKEANNLMTDQIALMKHTITATRGLCNVQEKRIVRLGHMRSILVDHDLEISQIKQLIGNDEQRLKIQDDLQARRQLVEIKKMIKGEIRMPR